MRAGAGLVPESTAGYVCACWGGGGGDLVLVKKFIPLFCFSGWASEGEAAPCLGCFLKSALKRAVRVRGVTGVDSLRRFSAVKASAINILFFSLL